MTQSQIITELSQEISKSEVIVVLGSTLFDAVDGILSAMEGKELIVIDPIKTTIAQKANLHIALAPRSDFFLMILLARFVFLEELHDIDTLKALKSDYEEFYDFVRTFRIKALLGLVDASLDDIGDILSILTDKKILFIIGKGIQRYAIAKEVVRVTESLAMILGVFKGDGCGVRVITAEGIMLSRQESFEFIDEYDDDFVDRKKLKRPKGHKSIGTKDDDFWIANIDISSEGFVFIHPEIGFEDGEDITIASNFGTIILKVKHLLSTRKDTICISAPKELLVQMIESDLLQNGCYGEVKVRLHRV